MASATELAVEVQQLVKVLDLSWEQVIDLLTVAEARELSEALDRIADDLADLVQLLESVFAGLGQKLQGSGQPAAQDEAMQEEIH